MSSRDPALIAFDPNDDLGAKPRDKKQYTTIVTERSIAAPRTAAFAALCSYIDEATDGPTVDGVAGPHGLGARFPFTVDEPTLGKLELIEEVISFEPPWRRVYEITGAPVVIYQATTTFTDQGQSCLMAWSLLVDPLPGIASDSFLAAAEQVLEVAADEVKARAENP